MAKILSNAFSFNMLTSEEGTLHFKEIPREEAAAYARGATSAVGHPDTAALLGNTLGTEVACNRDTVLLQRGDTLLVGQYTGERLPPGATTLPAGARIRWILVTVA